MNTVFSRRSFLAAGGAAAAYARRVMAQEKPNDAANFSTDVKVVNVLATVRDKQGKIVTDLTKDDFDLTEDGRPQTIKYFSRETDLPLTLGLLVDTSGSQRQVLGAERSASRQFIETVLREDRDQTFLIHFDRETELLQDLTPSRAKLERALDQLEPSEDQRPQLNRRGQGYPGAGGNDPGQGRTRGRGGTTLYDAILLASDELMRKRQGRKALVLLTDGVDKGSKVPLTEAIESAQKADTLVYSILFKGEEQQQPFGGGGLGGRRGGRSRFPQQTQQRSDGKKVLEQISRETGGGFFEVTKKQPIDQIYTRIEEELRSQYNLGFTSDKSGGGGEFRRIALTVKPKGMVVHTRQGYYAIS
ncbi:MAG TPA: VWA domain-containing protein [Bryobacteraceae bacterium]|nr:VWA domain-containing protein [Bryobacteraceae bacterium]